jgi:hypothetical protein
MATRFTDPVSGLAFVAGECLRMSEAMIVLLDGAANTLEPLIPGEPAGERRNTINAVVNGIRSGMAGWETQLAGLAIGAKWAEEDAAVGAAAKRYADEACEGVR